MIIKPSVGKFYPAPPAGTYQAVCVDDPYIGLVFNQFKNKELPMLELRFELDDFDPTTGKRWMLSHKIAVSTDDRSNVTKYAKAILGMSSIAGKEFDTEMLIGGSCLIGLEQKVGSKGGTFARVVSISATPKSMPALAPSGDYVREPKPADNDDDHLPVGDDIPF